MDLSLNDEQQAFRDLARDFLEKEAIPHRTQWDRDESVDLSIIAKMAEIGFFGLTIPEEYGGLGGDYITYVLGMEELGRADSALRGIVSVSNGLVGKSILGFGTEEQKQEWLPGIANGTKLGCFGLTEPDTGSDAANQKTRARRIEGGWSISGSKMFISLGSHAKVALIFAQTDPSLGYKGLACFLVDTSHPGYTAQEIHHKLGLRGSDTAELALDEVEVPDEAMLGGIGDGFKVAMSALDSGRFSVASGCVGVMQGCVDACVSYAKEREQFGKPIGSFQLVQAMIADMVVDMEAARGLAWRAGVLKDQGRPNTLETSIAKLHATEASLECANLAIQVHGGAGYVDDHPVERYFRDVRVTTLYEGTSQIQKLIIGRAATGINALA